MDERCLQKEVAESAELVRPARPSQQSTGWYSCTSALLALPIVFLSVAAVVFLELRSIRNAADEAPAARWLEGLPLPRHDPALQRDQRYHLLFPTHEPSASARGALATPVPSPQRVGSAASAADATHIVAAAPGIPASAPAQRAHLQAGSSSATAQSATQAQAGAGAPAGGYSRLVLVPDLHGDAEQALAALRLAGLVGPLETPYPPEASSAPSGPPLPGPWEWDWIWTGGQTLLVQLGDIVDRGPDSLALLGLFERLRIQARAAGGDVVMLLGNHELMLAMGDYRYVSRQELAVLGLLGRLPPLWPGAEGKEGAPAGASGGGSAGAAAAAAAGAEAGTGAGAEAGTGAGSGVGRTVSGAAGGEQGGTKAAAGAGGVPGTDAGQEAWEEAASLRDEEPTKPHWRDRELLTGGDTGAEAEGRRRSSSAKAEGKGQSKEAGASGGDGAGDSADREDRGRERQGRVALSHADPTRPRHRTSRHAQHGASSASATAAATAAARAAQDQALLVRGLGLWAQALEPGQPLGRAVRGRPVAALAEAGGCRVLAVHAGAFPWMLDAVDLLMEGQPHNSADAQAQAQAQDQDQDQDHNRTALSAGAYVAAWNAVVADVLRRCEGRGCGGLLGRRHGGAATAGSGGPGAVEAGEHVHGQGLETYAESRIRLAELLLGGDGPVWSRHFLRAPRQQVCSEVAALARRLGVQAVVVGHTVQPEGRVNVRCGGQLLMADVGLSRALMGAPATAVECSGGRLSVLQGPALSRLRPKAGAKERGGAG